MVAFPQQIPGIQAASFKNDSEDVSLALTIMLWVWAQFGRLNMQHTNITPKTNEYGILSTPCPSTL